MQLLLWVTAPNIKGGVCSDKTLAIFWGALVEVEIQEGARKGSFIPQIISLMCYLIMPDF